MRRFGVAHYVISVCSNVAEYKNTKNTQITEYIKLINRMTRPCHVFSFIYEALVSFSLLQVPLMSSRAWTPSAKSRSMKKEVLKGGLHWDITTQQVRDL